MHEVLQIGFLKSSGNSQTILRNFPYLKDNNIITFRIFVKKAFHEPIEQFITMKNICVRRHQETDSPATEKCFCRSFANPWWYTSSGTSCTRAAVLLMPGNDFPVLNAVTLSLGSADTLVLATFAFFCLVFLCYETAVLRASNFT